MMTFEICIYLWFLELHIYFLGKLSERFWNLVGTSGEFSAYEMDTVGTSHQSEILQSLSILDIWFMKNQWVQSSDFSFSRLVTNIAQFLILGDFDNTVCIDLQKIF